MGQALEGKLVVAASPGYALSRDFGQWPILNVTKRLCYGKCEESRWERTQGIVGPGAYGVGLIA